MSAGTAMTPLYNTQKEPETVREKAACFAEVFAAEMEKIRERRSHWYLKEAADNGHSRAASAPADGRACDDHPPANLVGLALSGGGIRSATFCLGILQGLSKYRLLHIFDYLSTVSGGGYIGGWWSAWLSRPEVMPDGRPREVFPPGEKIEPERSHYYARVGRDISGAVSETDPDGGEGVLDIQTGRPGLRTTDGAMSAGEDPIHHLRLFANYLTPRRGALSMDTWRALTVISRNLMMTWVILLPVLVAVVLAGQLYFIMQPDPVENFIHGGVTVKRMMFAAWPLVFLAGWIAVASIFWLAWTRDKERPVDTIAVVAGIAVVLAVVERVLTAFTRWNLTEVMGWLESNTGCVLAWVAGAVAIVLYAWLPTRLIVAGNTNGDQETIEVTRQRVRRTRITKVHAGLLVTFVWTGAILLLSGFGHEFVARVFRSQWAGRGGLILLLIVVAGSVYTWYKAAPTGGGDKHENGEPTAISRLIFAVTPTLVLAVLALIIAWASHWLLSKIHNTMSTSEIRSHFIVATFFSVSLCFIFAITEMKLRRLAPSVSLLAFIAVPAAVAVLALYNLNTFIAIQAEQTKLPQVAMMLFIAGVVAYLVVMVLNRAFSKEEGKAGRPSPSRRKLGLLLFVAALVAGAVIYNLMTLIAHQPAQYRLPLVAAMLLIAGSGIHLFALNLRRAFSNDEDLLRQAGSPKRKLGVLLFLTAIVAGAVIYFPTSKISEVIEPVNNEFQRFSLIILPIVFASLCGGLLLFRLAVVEANGESRGQFSYLFAVYRKWAENYKQALPWMLFSGCVVLVVAADSGTYALIAHSSSATDAPNNTGSLWPFLALPLPVFFLAVTVTLMRIIAASVSEGAGKPTATKYSVVGVKFVRDHLRHCLWVLASVAVISALTAGWSCPHLFGQEPDDPHANNLTLMFVLLSLAVLIACVIVSAILGIAGEHNSDGSRAGWPVFMSGKSARFRRGLLFLLANAGAGLAVASGSIAHGVVGRASVYTPSQIALTNPALGFIVLCACLVLFQMKWGAGNNRRSLWLLAIAYVPLTALLVISFIPVTHRVGLIEGIIGMLSVALALVVGLGWLADPNKISMHAFYQERLVRAYMGASNYRRHDEGRAITDSAADDDVPLKALLNCEKGGPYHLVNTTLNLVAGRDLTTAQRSAASFLLSRLFCGSYRTGFRPTDRYMQGRLSLGTAIAVSGAAASPNMGSRTPTSALAMLMTILNVRLGYWAPTPNRKDWEFPQARLWPFYLLREFASQTNELSDFCYLTDGGHFDNTGLYSLVERGCRYIVIVDCGADPKPCFADLGDAIRRCRIDFGAEIELDITPLLKDENDISAAHSVAGEITYSVEHVRALNWEDTSDEARKGVIVLFKPSRTAEETADVRQYGIEKDAFPQQSTTNQWFGEAQFESYRRLGQLCSEEAFRDLDAANRIKHKLGPCNDQMSECDRYLLSADVEGLFTEARDNLKPLKGGPTPIAGEAQHVPLISPPGQKEKRPARPWANSKLA